jgi:hypothetical protein
LRAFSPVATDLQAEDAGRLRYLEERVTELGDGIAGQGFAQVAKRIDDLRGTTEGDAIVTLSSLHADVQAHEPTLFRFWISFRNSAYF